MPGIRLTRFAAKCVSQLVLDLFTVGIFVRVRRRYLPPSSSDPPHPCLRLTSLLVLSVWLRGRSVRLRSPVS